MRATPLLTLIGLAALASSPAQALELTCPNSLLTPQRQASMSNVDDCDWAGPVTGTPRAADVAARYPGIAGDWDAVGEITSDDAPAGLGSVSDGFLRITVSSGSWGVGPVTGTWELLNNFWSSYSNAVMTFHVGNGQGDPDWWFFGITSGATSGTWSYQRISGNGGGLSNIFLWGIERERSVPEPGTLALFGLGLLGLGFGARRRKA